MNFTDSTDRVDGSTYLRYQTSISFLCRMQGLKQGYPVSKTSISSNVPIFTASYLKKY